MATQTQYYNLDKPSYDEVADIEIINANMDKIDQQMRNNADGVNYAKGISSDAYDNSKSYAVGDYCIYDNKLYKCITAITSAEAFDISKWQHTTCGTELSILSENDSKLNSNLDKSMFIEKTYNGDGVTDDVEKTLFINDTGKDIDVRFVGTTIALDKYFSYLEIRINGETKAAYTDTSFDTTLTVPNGSFVTVFYQKNTSTNIKVYSNEFTCQTITNINESLADYGLNRISTNWTQGEANSSGTTDGSTHYVSSDFISCSGGDTVTVKLNGSYPFTEVLYWNESTYLTYKSNGNNGNDLVFELPGNATRFRVVVGGSSATPTPQTVGYIGVYVNNAIDALKNDLSFIEKQFTGVSTSPNGAYAITASQIGVTSFNGYIAQVYGTDWNIIGNAHFNDATTMIVVLFDVYNKTYEISDKTINIRLIRVKS